MRDHNKCVHGEDPLCTCTPDRDKNILSFLGHLSCCLTDPYWELDYTDIFKQEKRRLCRIGVCRNCAGRLCHEMDASNDLAGDDFLAAVYRHMYQVQNSGGNRMSERVLREKFVQMFHEQDRAFIREWLAKPENSCVWSMYRRSTQPDTTIFTIVHTSVDADRGSFPPADACASFTNYDEAYKALWMMVGKEKDEMDIHFDPSLYREEYDENHWEAYQDGYAAAWFTRFDILTSPLYGADVEEKGDT